MKVVFDNKYFATKSGLVKVFDEREIVDASPSEKENFYNIHGYNIPDNCVRELTDEDIRSKIVVEKNYLNIDGKDKKVDIETMSARYRNGALTGGVIGALAAIFLGKKIFWWGLSGVLIGGYVAGKTS